MDLSRSKFQALLLIAASLMLFFQNCSPISYVAPKMSSSASSAELSSLPVGDAPSALKTLTITAPPGSAPVSGNLQLTGSASSVWTTITISDALQPTLSVSTTPVDGTYSVLYDTTQMADGVGKLTVTATSASGEQKQIELPLLVNNSAERLSLKRVNAGGPEVQGFATDTGFAGGTTVSISAVLTGFLGSALYDTARVGNFTYTLSGFPPKVDLSVRLYMAEIQGAAVGQRTFDISINGAPAFRSFDIVANAGAAFAATTVDVPFTTDANGSVVLQFSAVNGPVLLNALEVFVP